MRIATWNLDHGGKRAGAAAAQCEAMVAVRANLFVTTEPSRHLLVTPVEPLRRSSDSGSPPTMAIDGTPVLAYGAVLPWRMAVHQAPELALPGESASAMFQPVLRSQLDDMRQLRERFPDHLLIWAGDFNQSLVGANRTGSAAGRDKLREGLQALGLTAWNASWAHAKAGLAAIDLICGPDDHHPTAISLIPPLHTDHAGYTVDLQLLRHLTTRSRSANELGQAHESARVRCPPLPATSLYLAGPTRSRSEYFTA